MSQPGAHSASAGEQQGLQGTNLKGLEPSVLEHYKYDFTFKVFVNLILHLGSGVSFVPSEQGLM